MSFLIKISNMIIPLIVFYIVGCGVIKKQNVYEDFVDGAKDGIHVVIDILPTLIGLMLGVAVLRESGFLEFVTDCLAQIFENAQAGDANVINESSKIPFELVPIAIVKLFSSSAATGLLLDIYRNFGTDSYIGMVASVMMSSTETVFYTLSVYMIAAKVNKSRWVIPGAMLCTIAGIIASIMLSK